MGSDETRFSPLKRDHSCLSNSGDTDDQYIPTAGDESSSSEITEEQQ